MKCKTCKRKLKGKELEYCNSCKEFHKYNYSEEDLDILLETYDMGEK